jgi:hypothetical protein
MVKRKIAIWLLLCFCLSFLSCYAQAVSTEEAIEPLQPEKECTLTLGYCCDGIAFENVQVKLYKIAEVQENLYYYLTDLFADTELVLNGIRTTGEWNVVRYTLEAFILAHNIPADRTAMTDANGRVCFEALETGMYLAVAGQVCQEGLSYYFDSALVALPGLGTDGRWQYQVEVNAKAEWLPPVEPDEEISLKVLKLWKGDEGRNDRPKSVQIQIFRNGAVYETVTLSEENHWAYSWTAKDDGASWVVVEQDVPAGYRMTVEVRERSFVVTNTRTSDEPPVPPPQTGDSFNLLLPIVLMSISGSMLLLLGVIGKRNER